MIKKYRKKPIVIEAVQFFDNKECFDEIKKTIPIEYDYQNSPHCYISTLEGQMYVSDKDWIIKGIKGEFYPCKPDIFEKTYEEIQIVSIWSQFTNGLDKKEEVIQMPYAGGKKYPYTKKGKAAASKAKKASKKK